MTDPLRLGIAVCLAYLALIYARYLVMLVWSAVEKTRSTRRLEFDRLDQVIDSRFTIPVSVVAPVYNEAPVVVRSVRSFLDVRYPQHEVIVVNDGSTDDTLQRLVEAFALEPVSRAYRRVLEAAPISNLYRSRDEPRLLVVDKENGGKSDALNAGLNFARYRYVCGVDGDTILARRAPSRTACGSSSTIRAASSASRVTSRSADGRRTRSTTKAGRAWSTHAR